MKNIVLIIVSISISILLCEIVLRLATPFPVSEESNKSYDPVLGYRLSTYLDDVDQNGFRNPPMDTYHIAAIGDSHTFGVNVNSGLSWPSLLGKKTDKIVYNFGVGSYGILTYHAILKTLVRPGTEAVIIGLYPGNDFELKNSFCKINPGDSNFWKEEFEILELEMPTPDFSKADCTKKLKKNIFSRSKSYVINSSAFVSAVRFLVYEPLKTGLRELMKKDKNYYFFEGHEFIHPVSRARIKSHAKKTDINHPDTKSMYRNMEILATSWKEWSVQTGTAIGILLIPSMERVIYEHLRINNKLEILDKDFVRYLDIQVDFEDSLSELFDQLEIVNKNALNNTVKKLALSIQNGQEFYPSENGHPLEAGYDAYAESAYELLIEMNNRK